MYLSPFRRFNSSWSPRALWDKISNTGKFLKRITNTETPKPTSQVKIAPTPEHSLAAKLVDARKHLYRLRCKQFNRFSVRTAFIKYSPQKLNEVSRLLHGLKLPEALTQMQFQDRKGARLACVPAIKAAINVIKQRSASPKEFIIEQAMVGRGSYRKRPDFKGRGRMGIIRKPQAFLRLVCARDKPDERLKIQLKRSLHRMFKGQLRENKPVYCKMRY